MMDKFTIDFYYDESRAVVKYRCLELWVELSEGLAMREECQLLEDMVECLNEHFQETHEEELE